MWLIGAMMRMVVSFRKFGVEDGKKIVNLDGGIYEIIRLVGVSLWLVCELDRFEGSKLQSKLRDAKSVSNTALGPTKWKKH